MSSNWGQGGVSCSTMMGVSTEGRRDLDLGVAQIAWGLGADVYYRDAELAVAPEPAPLRLYVAIRVVARAR